MQCHIFLQSMEKDIVKSALVLCNKYAECCNHAETLLKQARRDGEARTPQETAPANQCVNEWLRVRPCNGGPAVHECAVIHCAIASSNSFLTARSVRPLRTGT